MHKWVKFNVNLFHFRYKIIHNFLPFSIAISEYKVQLLINNLFNTTFEKGLIAVNVGNALLLLALLLGSAITGFKRLPFNVIANCLLGSIFTVTAMKCFLEGGGVLKSTSFEVKQLLRLSHLKIKSYNSRNKVSLGDRKRILKSCFELRIQVVSNQHVKNSSFVEFMDVVLIQTVNYSVAIQLS